MKQHLSRTDETNADKLIARRNKALALRLEGMTDRAIADKLKISASQVNKDIQRATIDAYIFDHQEISKQRNMVTLQIQKLIDSWWTKSIGGLHLKYDGLEWEEYITYHLTESWYVTKDGKKLHHEDDELEHEELHNHFENETDHCDCEVEKTVATGSALAKGKRKWERDNFIRSEPSEKATKIIIDLMQMVIKLWGIEKPITPNPILNKLNSNQDN
mgnify:CR=1 FL=1